MLILIAIFYKDEKVKLISDIVLQSIQGIDYYNIAKFKKLLFIIATSVPYVPNISKLSSCNKHVLEVEGKNKSQKQSKGVKDSYVVKVDIEIGVYYNIPLWLFGFIY